MSILGGIGIAAIVVGVFVMTQIADSEGRTLADRVPVLGPVVRAIGLDSGGVPGGRPIIQSYDEATRRVETATCGGLRDASPADRLRIAEAFIEVAAREDSRIRAAEAGPTSIRLVATCAGQPDDLLVVEALAAAAP